jgi:hypothetical protein
VADTTLVEIAAALAAKAAESLYDLVRDKFRSRKKALSVLEAADGQAPDSAEVTALAEELAIAEAYDEKFSEQLRAQWAAIRGDSGQSAASGHSAVNQISGSVTGNVIQARDITGDITLG